MTDEERDAMAGRTLREYREAAAALASVQGELDRFANMLSAAAHLIRTSPDSVTQEMTDKVDGARLRDLLDERQRLRGEVERLGRLAKDLGL